MTTVLASWDAPVHRPTPRAPVAMETGGDIPWDDAVAMFLARSGLAESTLRHVRGSLLTGRVRLFREAMGLATVNDWTEAHKQTFITGITRSPDNPGGIAREGVKSIRKHLLWFGRWYAQQPWGSPALTEFPPIPEAGRTHAAQEARTALLDPADEEPALSKQEARILREAAPTERDFLLVKTMTYTGVRPSEGAGLFTHNIHIGPRDAHVSIVGSSWNPQMPKSPAGIRDIPLDLDGNGLPKDYRAYLPKREAKGTEAPHPFAFHHHRRNPVSGTYEPISFNTVDKMLERVERATKIHCNGYRFRHTFCTWCADAGVPPVQLATWMGHTDTGLIMRYYRRKSNRIAIEAANRIRF